MSGGGGSTNTIQSSTPWAGVQPGLSSLYNQAGWQFAAGGPQTQIASVAPFTTAQNQGLQALTSIGNGGLGTLNGYQLQALQDTSQLAQGTDAGEQAQLGVLNGTNPATQALTGLANGTAAPDQYLNGIASGAAAPDQYLQSMLSPSFTNVQNNPALNSAMNAANSNTNYNFTRDVMPGIASQFSAAGRFGSNAQTDAIGQATNNLATQISNTNAGMSLADLQQLQGLQAGAAGTLGNLESGASTSLGNLQSGAAGALGGMDLNAAQGLNSTMGSATQLLPSMATQGVGNASNLLEAGTAEQTQWQNYLNQIAQQFNVNQMQPWNTLNMYGQLLAGGNPYATTSSSGQNTNLANPFSTAIGAGLLGNSLYSSGALGSLFSGAAGAGAGAAAGGGATAAALGMLGSTGAEAAGGGMTALMGLGGMLAM